MSRYIQDVFIKCAKMVNVENSYQKGWNDSLDAVLENAPTADVKPVVHGKWIYTPHIRLVDETDEEPIYEKQEKCSCSVCGADFGFRKVEDNYCKYCGADMREGEEC